MTYERKMLSKPIYDILANLRRHIILICIYMFNVDTQKSHIWTSVSCFLSELGSIPLLLFIPSTNSGNYLSFSHSMDFSFSNFRRTMKFFPFCSPSTLRRFIILCKWVAIIFPSRQETHYKEVINFVRKCFEMNCVFVMYMNIFPSTF